MPKKPIAYLARSLPPSGFSCFQVFLPIAFVDGFVASPPPVEDVASR